MKKFASIFLALMLMLSMLICSIPVNAATSTAIIADAKGSVELTKLDSSVKDPTKAPVKDAGFSFYKILSYDASGYKLTGLAKDAVQAKNPQANLDKVINSLVITENNTEGEDGYISYGSTNDLEDLIVIFQEFINANSTTATYTPDKTGADGKTTQSEMDLGVYLVVETTVPNGFIASTGSFLVSVPTWNQAANNGVGEWVYNVSAKPKDEPFEDTVSKKIVADAGNKTETDANSYSIGDTVNYKVAGKVPNYGNSYRLTDTNTKVTSDRYLISQEIYDILPFVFTDKLSKGLTYADDLVIVAGSKTLTQDKSATYDANTGKVTWGTKGDYYLDFNSVESGGENSVRVIIKWDSINDQQGLPITFTYNAVVNGDAVVTDGNRNQATIYVANNPSTFTGTYKDTSTDEYTNSTDDSTVYTYEIDLTKTFNKKVTGEVDDADPTKVTFEISAGTGANDKVYSFLKTDDGRYTLWDADVFYTAGGKSYAVVYDLDTKGNKQAAGANDVKIGSDKAKYATGDQETSELTQVVAVGTDGTLNIKGFEDGTYYVTELTTAPGYSVLAQSVPIVISNVAGTEGTMASAKVEATIKNGEELSTKTDDTGVILITVNNSKNQFNLPQTGGMGLILFTVGAGVILAVAFIIIARLRKSKKEEA